MQFVNVALFFSRFVFKKKQQKNLEVRHLFDVEHQPPSVGGICAPEKSDSCVV